ncbi:hypothetical protein D7S86_09220 [Pararobbsia silviterrae]|uniref:Uncharacterized protein n=1 Tax=Pararobbsia silviterrae TaxID=1792498 RepID=A0A494Y7F4_9BURK|nr:hypothetical protein D7S86_09220 [Pararobbsia silviterrae]
MTACAAGEGAAATCEMRRTDTREAILPATRISIGVVVRTRSRAVVECGWMGVGVDIGVGIGVGMGIRIEIGIAIGVALGFNLRLEARIDDGACHRRACVAIDCGPRACRMAGRSARRACRTNAARTRPLRCLKHFAHWRSPR